MDPADFNLSGQEPSPRGLGLNILSDGDPQAGCPAIPVLMGNRSHPTAYTLSRLSQAGGTHLLQE